MSGTCPEASPLRGALGLVQRIGILAMCTLFVGASGDVQASNDNFRLSNMVLEGTSPNGVSEWPNGEDWAITSDNQQAYLMHTFSRELGSILSYKYSFAPATTGFYGFDIALELNNAYINTDRGCPDFEVHNGLCVEGYNEAKWDPWRVFDADRRLTTGKLYMVPGLRIRKGLPLSLEVGSAFYFLPFSTQAAIQGFGRWAIHEGYKTSAMRGVPDIAITVAYTQLLGNPEFDLSILDWGATFGYAVPVGGVIRSRVGDFSVFGGFGRSLITSAPDEQLPDELQCLEGYTGRQSKTVSFDSEGSAGCEGQSVVYDPAFAPYKGSFGIRVHNERYEVTVSSEFAGLDVPSISIRTGLMF